MFERKDYWKSLYNFLVEKESTMELQFEILQDGKIQWLIGYSLQIIFQII